MFAMSKKSNLEVNGALPTMKVDPKRLNISYETFSTGIVRGQNNLLPPEFAYPRSVPEARSNIIRYWGDAEKGTIHFMKCACCEGIPVSVRIFLCKRGHIMCSVCGKALTRCPYRYSDDSQCCSPTVGIKTPKLILNLAKKAEWKKTYRIMNLDIEEDDPEVTEAANPEFTEADIPEVTEADIPEVTEAANREITEAANPEITEATNPEVTEAAIPEVTEAANPEVTEAANPEFTEADIPEVTEADIPEVTEAANPEITEAANSEITEAANPEVTEAAIPETTEAANPEVTEATYPEVTEAANPEVTAAANPEVTGPTSPQNNSIQSADTSLTETQYIHKKKKALKKNAG